MAMEPRPCALNLSPTNLEHVEPPGPAGDNVDIASWVEALGGRAGQPEREQALVRLHDLLLRVALHELHRRSSSSGIHGPELDDLAQQATADAMLAILAKLDTFRGESRFTTWAYRFVVLEVSHKIGRHYWRTTPTTVLDIEQWDRLPDRFGLDPQARSEAAEFVTAVRQAIDHTLTDHQRRLFIAIVVNGVPLDALVAQLGVSRNAIYKVVFDARRKIRTFLVANGYLGDNTDYLGPDREQRR